MIGPPVHVLLGSFQLNLQVRIFSLGELKNIFVSHFHHLDLLPLHSKLLCVSCVYQATGEKLASQWKVLGCS